MLWPVWLLVLAVEGPEAVNLLSNSGFETAVADRPARWDVYLMPQDGAFARLDAVGHTGRYAAMIHVPLPYAEDPFNNWSQNVLGPVAGKSFRLSGYIKAQDAQDVALWVQCWRKQPLALLDTASTAQACPVYGTMDWTLVESLVDVPDGTDFLTVRCVMKGPGTAWFDDVALFPADDPPSTAAAPDAASPTAAVEPEPIPAPPVVQPAASAAPSIPRKAESEDSNQLRESNRVLRRTLDEMRQQNDALLQEVMRLRKELEEVRERVESAAGQPAPEPTPAPPKPFVSPIVPHSQNME